MPEQITEAGAVIKAPTAAPSGRMLVRLIDPGVGSSGVYPEKTLREAAAKKVFAKGLPSFLDHPGQMEAQDRPERSVRDLAGVLTEDAYWDGSGLVAEMQVFAPYRQVLAEMADHIGLSIRAAGTVEAGTHDGRPARMVTSLDEAHSVDFVTKAGRGGKVLQLLESARANLTEARNVGQHLESRLHQDFTNRADDMAANGQLTRDERIHLSNAVGKGLTAFAGHLEENAPQLYARDIYDEPPAAQPSVATESATTTVPARPGAVTTSDKKGASVPELSEADVAQLRESAARAEAAEARLAESTARIAAMEARNAARPVVAAKVAESKTLGARTQARLVESVVAALPVVDGTVAEEALTQAVTAAVEAAEAEAAEYGRPAPVTEAWGAFTPAKPTEVAEADAVKAFDAELAGIFHRPTLKG